MREFLRLPLSPGTSLLLCLCAFSVSFLSFFQLPQVFEVDAASRRPDHRQLLLGVLGRDANKDLALQGLFSDIRLKFEKDVRATSKSATRPSFSRPC